MPHYHHKEDVISLREMNATRQALMTVYRMFRQLLPPFGYAGLLKRSRASPERQQELDVYARAIEETLIGLQEYEAEIMRQSEVSAALDAQTGYGDDDCMLIELRRKSDERRIRALMFEAGIRELRW